MIRRSVTTGLLVGLLTVLVATYPTLTLYAGPRILTMRWPPVLHTLLLVLNLALGIAVLTLTGSQAARRSGVTGPGPGFQTGSISGLVVGLVFYALLLAPTLAVAASMKLWGYQPTLAEPYPPNHMAIAFVDRITLDMNTKLVLCLGTFGLLGGIEGAVVGWLRRRESPSHPPLLDLIALPHPRRYWFAGHDEVWKAGGWGGLIGGGVIWLGTTVAFFANLKVEWPALEAVVRENTGLITQALFTDALMNCLLPPLILAVLGTGALAVLLLRDPPRRHLSRFHAVLVAGLVSAVMIFLAVIQIVYFGVGLSRYAAVYAVQHGQSANPGRDLYFAPEWMQLLREFVRAPEQSAPIFYLLPLAVFIAILIVVLFWIAPQAAFYGLTLPLIFRRPVDRAARIARAVRSQPGSLLPRIYGLYANDDQALQVLPHLAFLLKNKTATEVVSAYHSLSMGGVEAGRGLAIIRRAIAEQEDWRWRAEISELHRVLEEGLAARTLAQVTAIQPPPREVTSSLPLLLAKSCEGIGKGLAELGKVERVDDLNTKIIFLNSAQAALLDLRRSTSQESEAGQACETPYPELNILYSLLDRWQRFVLMATQDLQGRADLQAKLLAHSAGFAKQVRQCIVVTNQGLNVAQNVCLRVAAGEGYRIAEGAEQQVEILGPGESRELEFFIAPDAPRRLRLAWKVTFDDAVDTGRQVEFADVIELVQEEQERPFQRIFPIPYVTGTPLRSNEMFFGRQDVFEFVREHLLGAYQNNVIVLHGQRRTGKTSILYRLKESLADTHLAVLVDMQGKAARGTADFLYALSDDIVYALENHNVLVDVPERSEYEDAPEFTFRSRFLRTVVENLDNRNLLLMFDEFEELQKRVEDGRLDPEIFAFLRNLMQHEPRLDFLFSGTHKLEELGAGYWSILFNIATYKRITFLDAVQVRRLATEPVAPYGMEYDPLALDRIIQVTAGHPYFAQVVCHEMVAYHNEVGRSYLTITCVDQVLERIIERGEAHFKYIWAGATPDEQMVMLALASLLPDADATTTPSQVAGELERKGYSLAEDALLLALARLQTKDILTRSGPQSSLYRFRIDLIRRWIGITLPIVTETGG